ncbi:hypothetical protein PS662_03631 [Pseudomonas fluorescens]|uniref:Uncharacterized protein n=1 Tax=Pseudomonas fluorescens TaxID=294 RepID=A0A5E6V200_PSEFL|nr:hypothetical protein PS662_03631 [Pseudomonas fluorescens]
MLFLFLIHPIPQFLPRFKMRDKLPIKTHRLARFRIAPHTRRSVVKRETAKPPNLNSIPSGKTLGHLFKHSLYCQFHIFR